MRQACDAATARILVIDSTPAHLQLITHELAEQAYQICFVPDGQAALDSMQAELPDLILLSVAAGGDTYAICHQLKADPQIGQIPIIFLQPGEEPLERDKVFAAGGVDYIPQPWQIPEAIVRIENQLKIQRLQKQLDEQNRQMQQIVHQQEQAAKNSQQQLQRTRLIQEITEAIRSQTESQSIFETAVEQIRDVFQTDRCSIHLYIPPPIPEILLVAESVAVKIVPMQHLLFASEIDLSIPEVLAQDRAIAAVDIDTDSRLQPIQALCHSTGIKSLIIVRTSYQGRANGVITLQQCDQQRIWLEAEITLLETIAAQIGIAIAQAKSVAQEQKQLEALGYQNLVLRQEISERRQAEEELQLLLNITQSITAAPDFNQALYVALQALCQTTGWIYGEVWLPSADADVLECSPVWYCNAEGQDAAAIAAVTTLRQNLRGVTFRPNEGIAGRVWSQQQSEWMLDEAVATQNCVMAEHSQYRLQLVNRYGVKARLGVPITVKTQRRTVGESDAAESGSQSAVLAVLVFFTAVARQQDQRLIQLVSAVAAQLGTVLAQKQAEVELQTLLAAMSQSAKQEQATLRVIERMRQTLDIEQIFSTTVDELRHLLKSDRVLIYRFNPDWSGEFAAESVASGWKTILDQPRQLFEWNADQINDDCPAIRDWNDPDWFQDTYLRITQGGSYSTGTQYVCIHDIDQSNLEPCYLKRLKHLQARSCLIVPIFQGKRLWGLLATYQNAHARHWQPNEIQLTVHISTQLGVALQQADLLTQTQQQTAALEKARDAAEAANRAKTLFLANMSHELRTPLNSILGFTQLIEREAALSSEHREYLSIINHSGQYLLGLINDVLEVAKLEANRISLQESSFALLDLFDQLREMLLLAATEKKLQLSFVVAATVPRWITADRGKLSQVLLNLLDNAIKFTQSGRVVLRVSLSADCQQATPTDPLLLHFEVEDTGIGIAAAEMDALFEAFVQTEAGRQSNQGTGLGLAISYRFVQLMGGKLQVQSTVGVGSVFEFKLPVQVRSVQQGEDLELHCIYTHREVTTHNPTQLLTPEDLKVMPAEWLVQLRQAASGCSDRQVLELVEQIASTYPHLAKNLEELAYNFRFEEIVELIKF